MVSHSVWMQKEFFYNKDIFNELGLEVPETWDQFIEVLDKIKASGMDPIAEGNQDKWPSAHYIGALNEQLVDDETRAKTTILRPVNLPIQDMQKLLKNTSS